MERRVGVESDADADAVGLVAGQRRFLTQLGQFGLKVGAHLTQDVLSVLRLAQQTFDIGEDVVEVVVDLHHRLGCQ